MQSGKQDSILNATQKAIIVLFLVLTITSVFIFRNLFYQSNLILKSFGELSIDPVIAFKNNKPTFLEFYAEWCEVCKEMAPKVSDLKGAYEKDINFVFLNVDNPKWVNYLREFDVNGIPQINLFDNGGNLVSTFIGKQEEEIIKQSIENLNGDIKSNQEIFSSEFSSMQQNNNYRVTPRSHG